MKLHVSFPNLFSESIFDDSTTTAAPAEEDAVVEVEEAVVVEEAPANEEAVADTAADATVSE